MSIGLQQPERKNMQPYAPYPPPQPYGYRPEKDYLGEALITLVLYYVGLGIVGLIVNIVFLGNARRDQSMGIMTRNVGCLQAILWFHIAAMVIAAIIACLILIVIPLIAAAGSSGY
jgi:Trk-type K+ transport system membrane component